MHGIILTYVAYSCIHIYIFLHKYITILIEFVISMCVCVFTYSLLTHNTFLRFDIYLTLKYVVEFVNLK